MPPKPQAAVERARLPDIAPTLTWHNESGLVVSPLRRALPPQDQLCKEANSTKPEDYHKVRYLTDENIYLAFYPRRHVHNSKLFAPLAVSDEHLRALIKVDRQRPGWFILEEELRMDWENLEDCLIQFACRLISKNPRQRDFPPVIPPRYPYELGYATSHSTYAVAYSCAKRSRAAFTLLSAFATFALTLWLSEFEDDCFDAAVETLATDRDDPMSHTWLKYLMESVVCDLTPGLRPGGFLDPHSTYWGWTLKFFCRASVPIWLVWGTDEELQLPPNDAGMSYYMPPAKFIEIHKQRAAVFTEKLLPQEYTYKYTLNPADPNLDNTYLSSTPLSQEVLTRHSLKPVDANPPTGPPISLPHSPARSSTPSQPSTAGHAEARPLPNVDDYYKFSEDGHYADEPRPPPNEDRTKILEAGSRQRPGESWAEFSERIEKQLENRKNKETPKERQTREDREAHAKKSGYSKSSTVFLWQRDDMLPTFYRRTRVSKAEAEYEWDDHKESQRRFWPHLNEWDLCPQLPRHPGEQRGPYSDSEDDDDDNGDDEMPEHSPAASRGAQDKKVGGIMARTVQQVAAREIGERDDEARIRFISLEEYLKLVHGYHPRLKESWDQHLHGSGDWRNTTEPHVIKRLLYSLETTTLPPWVLKSIMNFHHVAIGANLDVTYRDLPAAWDISPHPRPSPELVCDMSRLRLQRVIWAIQPSQPLFVLRPPENSRDNSRWFIATPWSTIVLLVYRKGWTTMSEIGRGLLEMGIGFRTVVERQRSAYSPAQYKSKVESLGSKPHGFGLKREDFTHYEETSRKVLHSASGRAIRLLGGIAGRIASEVVPDLEVLDGPAVGDSVEGYLGDVEFRDDGVDNKDLDIVSGVYHVNSFTRGSGKTHASLWPKHSTWINSGLAGDHWSPVAEEFYVARKSQFDSNNFTLKGAQKWKMDIRFQRTATEAMVAFSNHVADEFIRRSSRVY